MNASSLVARGARGSALLVPLVLLAPSAPACDYCLLSQGLSPLDTVRGHGARLTQRYTLLDSVYDGSDEVANPGVEEAYFTTEITAYVSPRDWLTVVGVLPVRVTRVDGHLAHDGGDEHEHEHEHQHGGHADDDDGAAATPGVDPQQGGDAGLGDFTLFARARVFEHHTLATTTILAVIAGVKTPTGTTDGRADGGEYLDAHLQLGTGSTDALVGLAASHARGRWSVIANVLGALKGAGEAGGIDYEYGDALNYDVSARYRVFPAVMGAAERQLFLSLGLAGEARGRERAAGVRLDDTGGHVLFVQPGLQLTIGARWTFEVAAQVPVHHDLAGTQLGEDLRVIGSLNLAL